MPDKVTIAEVKRDLAGITLPPLEPQRDDLSPGNALVLQESAAFTPIELLRIAVTQGADVDKLKQLMDLQERWEKNEARKAFALALSRFKANAPEISKNKHVRFSTTKGEVDYWHATLDHVCNVVAKELQKYGINHRWQTQQDGEWISVTCILTHELGHIEQTTLKGAPDLTGSKNALQAVGSTVTYLQRYTLLAATGLAAANTDNDGRDAGNVNNPMPDERLIECQDWLIGCQDLQELHEVFKKVYKEASILDDRDAQAVLIKVKDKRKKELQ